MCQFPLTGCLQKICNIFFAKLVQFVSLCHRNSKKLNFIKTLQVKVGQNKDLGKSSHSGSLLKPGFRPKGRALGMQEKSENFNSLRPILFELCKKKLQGGQTDPNPSRNRVNPISGFRMNERPPTLTVPHPLVHASQTGLRQANYCKKSGHTIKVEPRPTQETVRPVHATLMPVQGVSPVLIQKDPSPL